MAVPLGAECRLPILLREVVPILLTDCLVDDVDHGMAPVALEVLPTQVVLWIMGIVGDALGRTIVLPNGFVSIDGLVLPYEGAPRSTPSLPAGLELFLSGPVAYLDGIYV